MITTADFPALTDDLQSIFNEVAETKIAEMKGKEIFDVRDTDRLTFDHTILHGLDFVRKIAEGADLPVARIEEGDSITWTQAGYGGAIGVTKKMRLFDRYDQIEKIVKSGTEDAFDKIDQSFADVLLNGFSAANYTDVYGASVSAVGPDGLALFSAAHTNNINGNTFRNLIRYGGVNNPILTREAVVQARKDAATYKDPTGHKRPIRLDTLIVGPALEDEAERILFSDKISGSGDNDINPLKGKVKKLICWERLDSDSAGNDCSAFWFMADSRNVGESLQALFAERPSLDPAEQITESRTWFYPLDYYYAIGRGFPAYIWGSNGTRV